MCGIIGYIGKQNRCQDVLINGLEKLEYRGYDSAGIAYISNNNLIISKVQGKINNLKEIIKKEDSNLGIGHTRWATHGIPNEVNSHPHKQGKITIVHNGIIENYAELKEQLIKDGVSFNSNTDTEVAAALLNSLYEKTNDIKETMLLFKQKVKGAYALGIIVDGDYDHLYAMKKNSPLIIGIGNDENYIASDMPAIIKYTSNYIILNDGEFASINSNEVKCFDKDGNEINKDISVFTEQEDSYEKNGYKHFMLKEIHEQPEVFKNTVNPYLENGIDSLIEKMPDFSKYEKIVIVACGSAMHAGLVGKNMIEHFADVPVEVEIASEFRYKKLFINENSLVIAISQSGETADTLAAIEIAKEKNCDTLGIINRIDSSIARTVDCVLYTKAGIEIAVATTKAYSAQVALLSLIALNIASKKKNIDNNELREILSSVKKLPIQMDSLLDSENNTIINEIAKYLSTREDIYFIGRNVDYSMCMEGSLKLKEISYIHSDAYAAGELKHGTISLIEDGTPVIAIVTDKNIAEKTISNIKEVKSRGANITLIVTEDLNMEYDCVDNKIVIPSTHKLFEPLLTILPLQLLAYHTALLTNCDIDQPKNLAKSVTVE